MKPTSLAIDVGGRPLVLSSLRACFDPALRALFIADAHFGKNAVFARAAFQCRLVRPRRICCGSNV